MPEEESDFPELEEDDMPANLTPDYLNADEQYRQAKTPEDKLYWLEKMMSTIPKHKGTEKMRAEIKKKISQLRHGDKKGGGKRTLQYHVDKQGAGQVIVLGTPNAGKTTFVNTVTNARWEVADYPFTTRIMQPGMMPFENIQIQLVDTPAISRDYYERWVFGLIRHADIAMLMVGLDNPELLSQIDDLLNILQTGRIYLVKETEEDREDVSACYKKCIMVLNKLDSPLAQEHTEILKEFYEFDFYPISCKTGQGIEELKKALFESLGIIRIFTRARGKKPDFQHPFILKKGSTIHDLAINIHKDLAVNLKYARIWGEGYYEGQQVDRDNPLKDGDIVELHT